jgi:hypothetical protein
MSFCAQAPFSVIHVKDGNVVMCQVCAEGKNIVCQMKGNAATVEVNMRLNSWSALLG